MSLDKLVDSTQLDSDLTSVANAIRAKSGGSGQLAFPSGFVSEIGNIPSGGSSVPDFTLVGTQTITEPVSQVTFSIPAGTTQLLIVVSATITASRKSWFYWYFNNNVIFYYGLSSASASLSARNALYGKMVENGGQSEANGVTLAGASVGNLSGFVARDLSAGGTLKLTGYYSDSQLTGGTISVYWR